MGMYAGGSLMTDTHTLYDSRLYRIEQGSCIE